MTATVLQIVDKDDLSTVLWDFNDSTGAANTGTVVTAFGVGGGFALSSPDTEFSQLATDNAPGGITTSTRQPLKLSTWRLRMTASTYDNLVLGAGVLARLLQEGGVIKYVARGSANTRYIDFEPSPAPAFFDGQELELMRVLTLFDTPEGVPIQVWRQPFLRGPRLDSATNVLPTNALMVLDSDGGGRPDGWTWASTTDITSESISASGECYQFTIATGSTRTLRCATQTATAAVGSTYTGSFYAKASTTGPKAQVLVEFRNNADSILATATGTLTALTTAWQRLTVTTSAAPATTAYVNIALQMDNDDATSYTVQWRRAQLENASAVTAFVANSASVPNDPASSGGRVYPYYIQGDAEAPVEVTLTQSAGTATVYQALIANKGTNGRDGRGYLTDYINGSKFYQLESATTGTDTSTSNTLATTASPQSGSDALKTTFATATDMTLRASTDISTLLDSRRGTWDVYVRCYQDAAKRVTAQLRWGPSTASPAPYSLASVDFDLTDPVATSFGWVDLYLGRITITEDTLQTINSIRYELWAKTSATVNAYWDFLAFVPAGVRDQQATLTIPGVGETWLGKELTLGASITDPGGYGSGSVNGDAVELTPHATNKAAQTPPAAGTAWKASARHRVTFVHREKPNGTTFTYKEIVRKVGAGSSKVDSGTITSKRSNRTVTHSYAFDSDASGSYAGQAVVTSTSDKGQLLSVLSIKHETIPYIGSGEAVRTDPERFVAQKLDSSGNIAGDLTVQGAPPVRATPGLNVAYMHFGNVPIQFFDLADSKINTAMTVRIRYYPRYWA